MTICTGELHEVARSDSRSRAVRHSSWRGVCNHRGTGSGSYWTAAANL